MSDKDKTNDNNNRNGKNGNGEHYDPGRRRFIKNTGILAGGVVGGSILGGLLTNQFQKEPEQVQTETDLQDARMFFDRREDFNVLSAATERLFPKDDIGPGAIELGVPYFIDKQLNSSWGWNAKNYMKGPFVQNNYVRDYEKKDRDQSKQGPHTDVLPEVPTPRYQTRLNRGEIMLLGIRTMDQVSQDRYQSSFDKLEGEQQDEILTAFENGEIEMAGVGSETFFNLLLQLTIEGAFADPLYGGNKNMMGWKMKEYPGPRAAYIGDIESEDFIVMEQKSLKDYQS
ncbi:gluconate 2-dehydrogenase subunit 3 family protein [Pseudogracilibacillus sp. SE30717A]|uniref:gluconate 2-dehydrogenase subunit 3 family protein n=1 Tax=Pseudogracilibacillus sp. SE30717A TaxID=3098293 RepID=UPI00300E2B46